MFLLREFHAGGVCAKLFWEGSFCLLWAPLSGLLFFGQGAYEVISEWGQYQGEFDNVFSSIFVFLSELALPELMNLWVLLLLVGFLVTSVDSAVLVLSMFSEGGKANPSRRMRFYLDCSHRHRFHRPSSSGRSLPECGRSECNPKAPDRHFASLRFLDGGNDPLLPEAITEEVFALVCPGQKDFGQHTTGTSAAKGFNNVQRRMQNLRIFFQGFDLLGIQAVIGTTTHY